MHIFYGGLDEANKTELDLSANGAFMDYPIAKASDLLNRTRRNREAWNFKLGSKGGVEIEYDCIHAFKESGHVDDLTKELHLDSDLVLQVVKSFTEHIRAPKKD